jgi:GT2 family glycosyltransferase
MKRRLIDDYPSFNLMVKRDDFERIGGFKTKFWPGEDTKLCQDLVYKLGKKIVYNPEVVVYHHRRRIFSEHLKQAGRFGKQRGYFVKKFPKTSLRLRYFWPSLFVLGLMFGWLVWLELYRIAIFGYGGLLIGTGVWTGGKSKSLRIGFWVMPAIFLTHLVYGVKFIEGLIIGLGLGGIAKE